MGRQQASPAPDRAHGGLQPRSASASLGLPHRPFVSHTATRALFVVLRAASSPDPTASSPDPAIDQQEKEGREEGSEEGSSAPERLATACAAALRQPEVHAFAVSGLAMGAHTWLWTGCCYALITYSVPRPTGWTWALGLLYLLLSGEHEPLTLTLTLTRT